MTLTTELFKTGLDRLVKQDRDLGSVISRHGPPPLWEREPGFATLIHIILEQQVSLASAKAAFDKLHSLIPVVSAKEFIALTDGQLNQAGFSRQKIRYSRILAKSILGNELVLERLPAQSDDMVREELQKITGIGRWTADIYLLMALKRPDIWPQGDLALISALQTIKNLEKRPTTDEFSRYGEAWKPWRAIAARILWHHYLST